MPYVKNPHPDDREILVLRDFTHQPIEVKAGDWVEVPDKDAKSLEEQGWEVRKTDPGKTKGGS